MGIFVKYKSLISNDLTKIWEIFGEKIVVGQEMMEISELKQASFPTNWSFVGWHCTFYIYSHTKKILPNKNPWKSCHLFSLIKVKVCPCVYSYQNTKYAKTEGTTDAYIEVRNFLEC